MIGTVVGGEFRIVEKIGSGGMGSVYRAVQKLTERDVAIKVLHPHLCDEVFQKRFEQEAQIISRLSHPNIITVFKYGRHTDGGLYIAMEFVRGTGLDTLMGTGQPIDLDRALPLMVQIADAVAYANDQKIVHRDLKPENMILARTGRTETVKILDFGIAKLVDGNASITKTGMLCGSPMYMAPEQWAQARDLDGRTDVYALGCMFYEMVTGRVAFAADSVVDSMLAHTKGPTPRHPNEVYPSVSSAPALGDAIMKAISRDRTDRFPDAYALVEELKLAQSQFEQAERRFGSTSTTRPAVRSAGVSAGASRPAAASQPTLAHAPAPAVQPPRVPSAPSSGPRAFSPLVPTGKSPPRPPVRTKVLTPAALTSPSPEPEPAAPPDALDLGRHAVGEISEERAVESSATLTRSVPLPSADDTQEKPAVVATSVSGTSASENVAASSGATGTASPGERFSLTNASTREGDRGPEPETSAGLAPLREVEKKFRTTMAERRFDLGSEPDTDPDAPDPRLHVVLVIIGLIMCAGLVAAVVLLR